MSQRNPNLDPLTLPLNGSTLIEASAGTGKTFTIAILYVRLVLGHGQPDDRALAQGVLPPNLLVVTFTEAATQELRDRIRARLTQAAEVFSEQAPAHPSADTELLYRLRDTGYPDRASWPACRKKLLLAAEWMDEAAVSTIHSWCNRMLSEHAFDSGSLFKLTLATDQSDLLDDVVRDYWRTFIYPLPPTLMAEVLSHWTTPDALRQAVRPLLTEAGPPAQTPAPVQAAVEAVVHQRQARIAELKAKPWADWQPEVVELLRTLNKDKRLHGASMKPMIAAWDALLAWASSDQALPEGLDKAGLNNQTPQGLAARLKGDAPVPTHPAFDAIGELIEFSRQPLSARADILRHASHWIAERLEAEKQQRSEMGFDDLLTRLDSALHGPRGEQLAATIRRQFPVALIDEFQDTDPIQYRIFNRIYRVPDNDPDTCVLMIGDPKQAIYGFRGADIFTYLAARQDVAGRTWTLGRNFRSSAEMVTAVNRVFEHADRHNRDGAFGFGAGEQTPLPFQPVAANDTDRCWTVLDQPQPSLTFWPLEPDDKSGAGRKGLAKGRATVTLAEACASEVARLLALGQQGRAGFADRTQPQDLVPVRPKDMAILVNNRTEAAAIRDALSQRRIKSVYLSDRDSVLTASEAREVLTWLRACAEPRQLSLTRAALATPSLGQSWHRLDRLLTDELALEREIERFQGYQKLWQTQGVLPMLRRLLMDFDVPARLLRRPDGERRLTDLLHIAELLQQDSVTLDGEHALVHHYAQLLRTAEEEHEHRTLRLESDAGLVKVITVHKSKGLEYPLVFLPFGTAFRPESEKQAFVRYHDDQGQRVTVFDPAPEDLARANRERLGEDIRKLYVALTRARYATWVGVAAIERWTSSALGYLLGGEAEATLSQRLQAVVAGEPAMTVAPLPAPESLEYREPAPDDLGPALIADREAREDWRIASYSALEYTGLAGTGTVLTSEAEDAEAQHLIEEGGDGLSAELRPQPERRSLHRFPKGAGPGTFLHDLLEWCAGQGFDTVLKRPELLRDQLSRRCTARGWTDWVETLEHWLLRLLSTPLPLPRQPGPQVALAALTNARPELEFWFESRQVATRTLDRLVCRHTLKGADRPQVEATRFNGMLKGFIDLVFEHDGRYYVLDYKSNSLGDDDDAYTEAAMAQAILDKRYDLQYALYLLALHRLLRARLPDYDYDRHVGGAVYLFLRGIHAPGAGVFTDKPPRALIEQLDALFDGDAITGGAAA